MLFIGSLACLSVSGKETLAKQVDLEKYRADAVKVWSGAIADLEAKDKTETHPDDSILFVGSSSIRGLEGHRPLTWLPTTQSNEATAAPVGPT